MAGLERPSQRTRLSRAETRANTQLLRSFDANGFIIFVDPTTGFYTAELNPGFYYDRSLPNASSVTPVINALAREAYIQLRGDVPPPFSWHTDLEEHIDQVRHTIPSPITKGDAVALVGESEDGFGNVAYFGTIADMQKGLRDEPQQVQFDGVLWRVDLGYHVADPGNEHVIAVHQWQHGMPQSDLTAYTIDSNTFAAIQDEAETLALEPSQLPSFVLQRLRRYR